MLNKGTATADAAAVLRIYESGSFRKGTDAHNKADVLFNRLF